MAVAVLLLLSSFLTVFAQDLHTLPPSSPTHQPAPSPHHHHHHPLSPTSAPVHSPAYPPHHHHHHHSPAPAPVAHQHLPPTPTPSPLHPHYSPTPAPAPAHPPVPRSFVAVQGVVYVKSCKYASVDTLLGALPLLDATVKLQCNNTRYKLVQTAKTDKNGYFFLEAPKSITTYGAHKCNVVLVSAPNGLKPSNLHGGITGALLRPQKPYVSDSKLPFFLYTVGPLAFQPNCPK